MQRKDKIEWGNEENENILNELCFAHSEKKKKNRNQNTGRRGQRCNPRSKATASNTGTAYQNVSSTLPAWLLTHLPTDKLGRQLMMAQSTRAPSVWTWIWICRLLQTYVEMPLLTFRARLTRMDIVTHLPHKLQWLPSSCDANNLLMSSINILIEYW